MGEDSDNPFWTYSVALYGRNGVAAACLELQDRLDLDVNVVLFCCWAGTRGRALSAGDIRNLVAATGSWRDRVIRPLRAMRRWLKSQDAAPAGPAGRLRDDIKASELAAEAIEHGLLFRAVSLGEGEAHRGAHPGAHPEARPGAVAGNLRGYLSVLGQVPGATDIAALAAILRACCPPLTPLDAVRLIDL